MHTPSGFLFMALSAVALVLPTSHLQAQQQVITDQEANAYFRQIQKEATGIVSSQDYDRLDQWIGRNIADGAIFQASMTFLSGGDRKGFAEMTFEKEDLRRMGLLFAGTFQQQPISDYSLEVTVTDVSPHGSGAATATVQWIERFSLNPTTGTDAADKSGHQFEAVANCTHLVQRLDDGLAIGLSTCSGELRL